MYNVNDYGILFMHAPVVSINGLIFPGNIGRQLTGAATTLLGGASGPFFGLTTVNVYNKKSGRWFHQLPPIKKEKKTWKMDSTPKQDFPGLRFWDSCHYHHSIDVMGMQISGLRFFEMRILQ